MKWKKALAIAVLFLIIAISNLLIFLFITEGNETIGSTGNIIMKILLCVLLDITIIVSYVKKDTFYDLFVNIRNDKKLILKLSVNDFKSKFAGSYFGAVWAVIQPVITVFVYWFALEIGLRAGKAQGYPFILWLMCGLVPWFFFSEALSSGTNALTEYSYLVKKVVFKIEILPYVKVISAIFVHFFFVAFIVVFHAFYRYFPDLYTIQLIYYIICMFALTVALAYITSSVVIFFQDMRQVIAIILNMGIWVTPIMWDARSISMKVDMILKINPLYYIVNGFRDSLLTKTWFWERPVWTIGFWIMIVLMYVFGRSIFKKLQVHFADVM